MDTSPNKDPQVLYVFDAYCGWCYGFSKRLAEYEAANRDRARFGAISGGLFIGERARPMRTYAHVAGANARIAEMSGVTFGKGYNELLNEGSFVMNSADAAAGFAALRDQAPDRGVELVHPVQEAFYLHGRSLSDPQTFIDTARKEGLDGDRVSALLTSGRAAKLALDDFQRARELGVTSYPSVLYVDGNRVVQLPATGSTLEQFSAALDNAMWLTRRHSRNAVNCSGKPQAPRRTIESVVAKRKIERTTNLPLQTAFLES